MINILQILALFFVTFSYLTSESTAEEQWKFIVLADWHGGEAFSYDPGVNTKNYKSKVQSFQYINDKFGGDMILIPGDMQAGHWYYDSYINKYFPELSTKEAVIQAGKNCYSTIKSMFSEAGYDTILVSPGDHEYGDNPWLPLPHPSMGSFDEFQSTFFTQFNLDDAGNFLFPDPIGSIPSTPIGTPFEKTSYAYQYKNLLVVTIDAFQRINNGSSILYDRESGRGGDGVISSTVQGQHLVWFKKVLEEARNDPTIKHIVVQAHVPVIYPIRKVNSSGMSFDLGEYSFFWKIMRAYNVDAYFAGEVHANTVTKDPYSNLIQVVSRGNGLNNILTVDVDDDILVFKSYNEIGDLPKYNNNHTIHGELVIDKSGNETSIYGSGVLEPLNTWKPLLHFDFEEIHAIDDRQVPAMSSANKLIADQMNIRGKVSTEAIWNKGTFSQQYDMQVTGINLVPGAKGTYGAEFNINSRAAIYGVGPHVTGNIISYALWIRTDRIDKNMILIHYGRSYDFTSNCEKDQYTLMLEKGIPVLYRCIESMLIPLSKSINLSDGSWHHIAVMMPKKSCLFSKVMMYIDGQQVPCDVKGIDDNIFFFPDGRVSVGSFGYSADKYDDLYPNHINYIGAMDEFQLFSRVVRSVELKWLSKADSMLNFEGRRCNVIDENIMTKTTFTKRSGCHQTCVNNPDCQGYQMFRKWKMNPEKNICITFGRVPDLSTTTDPRFTCNILQNQTIVVM